MDFSNVQLNAEQVERLIQIEAVKAQALFDLAASMPALIEKLGSRGGGGGGNWKKKGESRGTFRVPPDLSSFNAGDTYLVPVSAYRFDERYSRYQFFGPFDKELRLSPEGRGVVTSSVKTDAKAFEANKLGEMKFNTDGNPHPLILRFAEMTVGEKDGKKFSYFSSIALADDPSPDNHNYNDQPIPPVPANGDAASQ